MSRRLNWEKAKPFRQIESKVAPGTILPNGERVPWLPQDSLAKRAAQAEREWLQTLSSRHRRVFAR
jgi:hypothetical protein